MRLGFFKSVRLGSAPIARRAARGTRVRWFFFRRSTETKAIPSKQSPYLRSIRCAAARDSIAALRSAQVTGAHDTRALAVVDCWVAPALRRRARRGRAIVEALGNGRVTKPAGLTCKGCSGLLSPHRHYTGGLHGRPACSPSAVLRESFSALPRTLALQAAACEHLTHLSSVWRGVPAWMAAFAISHPSSIVWATPETYSPAPALSATVSAMGPGS